MVDRAVVVMLEFLRMRSFTELGALELVTASVDVLA